VRQAFSMSWDRDMWLNVVLNVENYESAGLPVDIGWTTCVEPEYRGFWLDPQDAETFGENSKYFQHNLEDAKKLMEAAGFGGGVTVDSNWPATGYGTDLGDQVQILEGMARDAGFEFNTTNPDFNTAWATKYRDSRGNYQGLLYRNFGVSGIDPVERLWKELNSGPTNLIFTGFDPAGKGDFSGDPTLEDMIRKARGEQDNEARKKAVQDVQRIMAQKLYNMRFPGQGSGFALVWPAVRNFQVNRGSQMALGGPMDLKTCWIDATQAPLA
jgi:ABC-type transport system substrate-binding protein